MKTARSTYAPAMLGLILSLPPAGTVFTREQRRAWLRATRAVMAFAYEDPEREDELDEPPFPLTESPRFIESAPCPRVVLLVE